MDALGHWGNKAEGNPLTDLFLEKSNFQADESKVRSNPLIFSLTPLVKNQLEMVVQEWTCFCLKRLLNKSIFEISMQLLPLLKARTNIYDRCWNSEQEKKTFLASGLIKKSKLSRTCYTETGPNNKANDQSTGLKNPFFLTVRSFSPSPKTHLLSILDYFRNNGINLLPLNYLVLFPSELSMGLIQKPIWNPQKDSH